MSSCACSGCNSYTGCWYREDHEKMSESDIREILGKLSLIKDMINNVKNHKDCWDYLLDETFIERLRLMEDDLYHLASDIGQYYL